MKILFTGFTSRTVGSDRNQYDYMSNVFVLERALTLAGHTVDVRPVSLLEDPCPEEDYDCAVVGIAACQGLSSRFKLGALWTLHRFGKRAGIFPSDGKNLYIFPNSVRTCLMGDHRDGDVQLDPIDYLLGYLQREKNNVLDVELGRQMKEVWREVLTRLPHVDGAPKCDWKMLIPTHSWGNPTVYERHFGTPVTNWDPTNVAIPMQFAADELGPDGRLCWADKKDREKRWVISSLQDQSQWVKRVKPKWPVVVVGNKRAARKGEAIAYVPERDMIASYYHDNWGHLAFGYPLADGGWWRMRYVHAALSGIVTYPDETDQIKMPDSYRFAKSQIEAMSDDRLAELAAKQHRNLMDTSWTADHAVTAVDRFVKGLVV